ncbi:aminomethyltransferase family protein [Xinfangfangia sp. CPCC 101601]|uniref:Aminomethyltransferase family protein n=1 Tax=Pseudogemmobacter lacusdianii TaxID=3069608 RepID=A0ABU0VTB7_9RHOB|nr:aminomethyltransferase family protein [Xinfangfangia sp. CPCC 101601]MDQ2064768.1 aminomethyltransferase family protein [Xinfangfangia sp. CPCC 101601]
MSALTHFRTPLLQTPFHARTSAANTLNRWGPWGGYMTALCFGDADMEYTAIRNGASVYDLCPMVKYRITGRDAAAYLNRLTLRNAAKLSVGGVHYTAWTDDAGKIMDDGTLFRHGPEDYLICCQERHLPWLLASSTGFEVHVEEVTEAIAALSLQGPCSASVLEAAGFDVQGLKPFRMATYPFEGGEITISRTGFTGDLGYELWLTPDQALPFWDHLFAAGAPWGIRPIGSDALDLARIEAGFIITNMDFIPVHQALREDRARSPFELGLGWMIDWEKGHFTGRRALLAEKAKGSDWALIGIDIPGNISAEGAILYHGKKVEAGVVTAAAWSPALKANLAIAQVQAKYAAAQDLWVEIYAMRELQYAKLMLPVTLTERPFFNPARKRATPPGRV